MKWEVELRTRTNFSAHWRTKKCRTRATLLEGGKNQH
ncbi:unnamed protein product, partial [Larinioides sclopetarius]